jgi:hypothetical protein
MKKLLIVLVALALAGCSSVPVKFPTPLNQVEGKDYKVLGESEGSSVGIMLFQFIPINQNDRFQKAYDEAVQKLGGDRLINPQIEERWFWAWVLNGYAFTVKGTVVKDLTK